MTTKSVLVPPDGGWGWVIVFAMGLNNVIYIPILQNFGLIFSDAFDRMGFSATDGSIIITMNAGFSLMSGLINGPLLKVFGYRKVSIVGALLVFVGLICTGYSTNFTAILISYGFITSLGMGMEMSSYPLALNTYFRKLRSKAMGIGMTITGIGPIVMPQLISFLLYYYDISGAVLVLAGLTANSFVSAMLLQPIKWHMVEQQPDEEGGKTAEGDSDEKKDHEETLIKNGNETPSDVVKKSESLYSLNNEHNEIHAIYGFDTPLAGSVLSLTGNRGRRMSAASSYRSTQEKPRLKWQSANSIDYSNYGSLPDILEAEKAMNGIDKNTPPKNEEVYNELSAKIKKESKLKRSLKVISNFFDLSLLKDPIYLNIMAGMSFALFAEMNFSLLTPFILADFDLDTPQIATFLSCLAVADILFRFLAPFIGDYFDKPPRIMYGFTLVLLIITRYSLLLTTNYTGLLVVAVGLGIAKGVRTVYMSLVIPSYVPIERLANASGLQMMVNGVLMLIGGPVVGMIRDVTGSYTNCIYVLNTVTFLTIVLWSIEAVYMKYKSKKAKEAELENL